MPEVMQPNPFFPEWDYLVVSASNDRQAEAYRRMLDLRKSLGLVRGAKKILVVPDPGGRRVGSGGSTIYCLERILEAETGRYGGVEEALSRLRILIVHAGGDSKRLPPYGPCGKIFIPIPGEAGGAAGTTIFDRLLPTYFALPRPAGGGGQVVVASGDVLLDLDADEVVFATDGITGVGALASPEVARNHGVFCPHREGGVRLFLQKPSVARQAEMGAVDAHGHAVLDIGILNISPRAAASLIGMRDVAETAELDIYREICCAMGKAARPDSYIKEVRAAGSRLDEAALRRIFAELRRIPFHVHVVPRFRFLHFGTLQDLIESGRALVSAEGIGAGRQTEKVAGERWGAATGMRTAARGTIGSLPGGIADNPAAESGATGGSGVVVNSRIGECGAVAGKGVWVEGCAVGAPLALGGENVVVGVDIAAPLTLARGACLDVIEGRGRSGRRGWFVRMYAADDIFHVGADRGARLAGMPVADWLETMGAGPGDVWGTETGTAGAERTVWNGRFFPLVDAADDWREWTWLSDPRTATVDEKARWRAAERYSLAEIAAQADLEAFLERRMRIRGSAMREQLYRAFSPESELSAAEMAIAAREAGEAGGQAAWIVAVAREAVRRHETLRAGGGRAGLESLELSRILHTLGSIIEAAQREGAMSEEGGSDHRARRSGGAGRGADGAAKRIADALRDELTAKEKKVLASLGVTGVMEGALGEAARGRTGDGMGNRARGDGRRRSDDRAWLGTLAQQLKDAAFRHLGRTIVNEGGTGVGKAKAAGRAGGTKAAGTARGETRPPRNALRSDEIVWGRAPARLDLGGGWTDTPPYSLERGGCVINAAVELNGQAPIQAYARVIEEREVRINSIDHSTRLVIRDLDELLDYAEPASRFGLAKAALALSGFAPGASAWPAGTGRSLERMLKHFGGGIELTTLAAIPSGSGLGTSSIMGAVLMSIIGRVVGRPLAQRELFHAVLKLEQALTTGGGWQDQIGGAVEGVKMITAERGLVPDPRIRFVPADVLDPAANGGRTLLYYTGLRRLAKNILHEVVGRYLDRDRRAMETLRRLHAFPPVMAEAMGMRDMERFGGLIDVAWRLNVDLDPDHATPEIEAMRERIAKHVFGAKLLGAGGGGFLLMACKTAADAAAVRRALEKDPPNARARFFDYSISRTGLVVTVC